jgi:hypothetical protein
MLKFKLFDALIDNPVQLINQLLNISSNNPIDHSLVFSTSAAILSTVFTIVFVLLTVLVQMSGGHMSSEIFESSETKKIIILYFVSIVFSLMMLETTIQFPILVLILTFACIFSLYPFLRNISNKFQYKGLEKLSEEISLLIDANKESLAYRKMESLADIGIRSIDNNRLKDFHFILSILETHTKKAKQQQMIKVVEIAGDDYSSILYNSIKENSKKDNKSEMITSLISQIDSYIKDYSDTISFESLCWKTECLNDIGKKMIRVDFDDKYVSKIVQILFATYFMAQKNRSVYYDKKEHDFNARYEIGVLEYKLEPKIVEYIGTLATESHEHKLEFTLTTSMEALFAIGVKACQINEKIGSSDSFTSDLIVKKLNSIEDVIGSDDFEKRFKKSKNPNKCGILFDPVEFEDYSNMFERYYKSKKN